MARVPRVRPAIAGFLRAVGCVAALVGTYYALPIESSSGRDAIAGLVLGLVVLVGMVIVYCRSILRAEFPGLRAMEALAACVPLFLLLFAATYIVVDNGSANNFSERMTHTTAIYFTVTVFSTVGFGDVTPKSDAARLLVTGQMITDLVILGLAVKVIVGAVRRRRGDAVAVR